MNIPGILYIPTKSLDESTPNSSQFEVVVEKHFTFNSENSATPNGGVVTYLTIPLNELRVDDATYNNKRYNAIVVNGYIISSPSLGNASGLKFYHSFVTDWNLQISPNNISLQNFESQPENTDNNWSPAFGIGWVNGTGAVNGTYWDGENNTVIGWSCKEGATTSGFTGPAGGVDLSGTTPPFAPLDGTGKYIYTESSSPYSNGSYVWVSRTQGINFSTAMDSTSNNLKLIFYVHGFGTQMGDLGIFIDTAASSNNGNATSLQVLNSFSQTSHSSPYTKIEIDLNSYRTVNSDHYIYFVYQGNTGFRGDLALDGVTFQEELLGTLNSANDFTQVTTPDGNGLPINASTVSIQNVTGNSPIINFKVQTPSKDVYVKGSYLLM